MAPPTVHQMILKLEENELISRVSGQARSITQFVTGEDIPQLK
jgi:DNA-binding MarR family transcriptional regulator